MSTESVMSPAPASPPPAVDDVAMAPNPISTEDPGAGDKPEPVKADKAPAEKPSVRDALKAAAAKLEKQEGDKPTEAKPTEAKPADKARDDTGKFAKPVEKTDATKPEAKTDDPTDKTADKSVPHHEPPARFSPEAKAKWAETDETVRAETHRAVTELEKGFAKHRQAATDYEQFREFHDLAKQTKSDPVTALREYVGIDRLLSQDLVAGLERICANKGISLKEVAAQVMGQPADQQARQSDATIRNLQQQIARIEQTVSGVSGHLTDQQSKTAADEVTAFAADKPLFDELSQQIVSHIANDGLSLQEAYDKALNDAQALAQRLGFIPKTAAAPIVADVDLEAQTQKGQKSIAGAPSAGSAPATQKPSSSIKDALRKALAAV